MDISNFSSDQTLQISEEQKEIVKKIGEGNVVVSAVAGSGKTTCNLFIALQCWFMFNVD